MDGDEGRTRSLPFFCWCDGGSVSETRLRPHRHMILVSRSKAHFNRNVWKKIRVAPKDRPDEQFRAIHREPIKSAMHLVNTLGYVSQRKSVCKLSGDKKNAPEKMNHYQIRRSLPRDYRLALVLEWPNGLYELLNQEHVNMEYDSLVRSDMVLVNAQWRIRIRSIPGIGWGKRLPLSRHWHPWPNPTPHALHLMNGKTLFFKFNDSQPTEFAFYFYDAVQDDMWAPKPFLQTIIKKFRPFLNRITELEKELQEKDRLVERLQAENNLLSARMNQPQS